MSDCITCPKCEGVGMVPLSKPLMDTLAILRGHGEKTTADVLSLHHTGGEPDLELTALLRRLDSLRSVGLVKRSGRGVPHDRYRWEAIWKD